MVKTSGLERMI